MILKISIILNVIVIIKQWLNLNYKQSKFNKSIFWFNLDFLKINFSYQCDALCLNIRSIFAELIINNIVLWHI
jgi:hypothetical protein